MKLSWIESYGDRFFNNLDMAKLDVDGAYLTLTNEIDSKYKLYYKYADCNKCNFLPFQAKNVLSTEKGKSLMLEHVPDILYRLVKGKEDKELPEESSDHFCQFGHSFGEFGVYNLNIINNSCRIETINEPVSIALPIVTVFLIFFLLSASAWISVFLWHKYKVKKDEDDKSSGKKPRVASLDTFRGISMVVMIFINYGAGAYSVIDHAVWNGLQLADLVFPWFMWIMGVCIPISLASSFRRNMSKSSIFWNVLKRSIKLFCLGVFLASGTNLERLRLFAVLQRFGITYFVATTICIYLMENEGSQPKVSFIGKYLKDVFMLWKGWLVILGILLTYLLLIFFVAEDGCPKGYLGPGGLHEGGKYPHCVGGATGYIDRLILRKHRYQYPTANEVYKSGAFDPEGVLGCLPSIVHVFIGVQAGLTLQVYKEHKDRLIRWVSWGTVLGILGGGLCGFSKDDGVIPVNKNLWSLSFVMVTCSFAFFLLSACYIIIDVKKYWTGKPFLFAGMNAILIYIGHNLTWTNFPVRWDLLQENGQNTHFFILFQNIWGTCFWIVVSYYLYKIKYFFTL